MLSRTTKATLETSKVKSRVNLTLSNYFWLQNFSRPIDLNIKGLRNPRTLIKNPSLFLMVKDQSGELKQAVYTGLVPQLTDLPKIYDFNFEVASSVANSLTSAKITFNLGTLEMEETDSLSIMINKAFELS